MDISIDTTHPLNDVDRAVLRALLESGAGAPAAAHGTPGAPRRAADLGAAIGARVAGSGTGPAASARQAVATQPGVSFTESTSQDADSAG